MPEIRKRAAADWLGNQTKRQIHEDRAALLERIAALEAVLGNHLGWAESIHQNSRDDLSAKHAKWIADSAAECLGFPPASKGEPSP